MTYQINWNAQGWHVTTTLGSVLVGSVVLETYGEALAVYVTLTGGR